AALGATGGGQGGDDRGRYGGPRDRLPVHGEEQSAGPDAALRQAPAAVLRGPFREPIAAALWHRRGILRRRRDRPLRRQLSSAQVSHWMGAGAAQARRALLPAHRGASARFLRPPDDRFLRKR